MTKKTYPEDIYKDFPTCGSEQSNIAAHAAGRQHAYNMGFNDGYFARHQAKSLTGWSNLTEAIEAGERIDWERLDGLEAQCVHPEMGVLTRKLVRDQPEPPNTWMGWGDADSAITHWDTIFECAWRGSSGWELYIKGDLPLRNQTADQLAPGTCFRARYKKGAYTHTYSRAQTVQVEGGLRVLCFNEHFTHIVGRYKPAEVEVLEVYGPGTFQTPEGDA